MCVLGHNSDVAKRYTMCEQVRGQTVFCVKASDTAFIADTLFWQTCVCIQLSINLSIC